MMRILLSICLLVATLVSPAQNVLHFTRTSGFDHNTRVVSFAMFTGIGNELEVTVDDDSDGSTFSSPELLSQYDVIVFSNTSGDAILEDQQRTNFEQWVAAGGHVMGIHAASDTYRHSTANGGNTGTWDFYAELIGGSVQENPNHVTGTPEYSMMHIAAHPSITNIPDPWVKEEEYYYWLDGYLHPQIIPVLEVEETIGPNGQVNAYDAPRPMSWYRIMSNSRVFYTALGHAASNFTSDPLFRTHIKDALVWLLSGGMSIDGNDRPEATHHFDPSGRILYLRPPVSNGSDLRIMDATGRTLLQIDPRYTSIGLQGLPSGMYLLEQIGSVPFRFIIP